MSFTIVTSFAAGPHAVAADPRAAAGRTIWTSHMITNILVEQGATADLASATAAFTVHNFDPSRRTQHVFFGRYEHIFRRYGEAWRIAAKTTILANDYIPTVADFYLL